MDFEPKMVSDPVELVGFAVTGAGAITAGFCCGVAAGVGSATATPPSFVGEESDLPRRAGVAGREEPIAVAALVPAGAAAGDETAVAPMACISVTLGCEGDATADAAAGDDTN